LLEVEVEVELWFEALISLELGVVAEDVLLVLEGLLAALWLAAGEFVVEVVVVPAGLELVPAVVLLLGLAEVVELAVWSLGVVPVAPVLGELLDAIELFADPLSVEGEVVEAEGAVPAADDVLVLGLEAELVVSVEELGLALDAEPPLFWHFSEIMLTLLTCRESEPIGLPVTETVCPT